MYFIFISLLINRSKGTYKQPIFKNTAILLHAHMQMESIY